MYKSFNYTAKYNLILSKIMKHDNQNKIKSYKLYWVFKFGSYDLYI